MRSDLEQAGKPEREQVAAFRRDEGVQFIEHDTTQSAEQKRGVGACEQQRELLGRGQQNVGRIAPLPAAFARRGVAGPRLDADRQGHVGHRPFQVARDVDGQRLERRYVKGVKTALALVLTLSPCERGCL